MILNDPSLFWNTAHSFLDIQLKSIRQLSENTIQAYRNSLNLYIDFAEKSLSICRKSITFEAFTKDNLKQFQSWMLLDKKLAPKTSNLRMTAIRSLLEYASQEHVELMHLYVDACSIKNTMVSNHPIEYFEEEQLKALLTLPDHASKADRRNNMILILMYDTAIRVNEARTIRVQDLHLNATQPYVQILGKGRKHRNIPLMTRTVLHLKQYLLEYHGNNPLPEMPLFFVKIKGSIGMLSTDTFETMIKRYARSAEGSGTEMPKNVHCHMLRKTRAMDLYHAGVPLSHIQQLLGHESIATTTGFYAFATLDILAESLNKANPDDGVKSWEDPEILKELYRL